MSPISENNFSKVFEDKLKSKNRTLLFLSNMRRSREAAERSRIFEGVIQAHLDAFQVLKLEDPEEALKALSNKNVDILVIDSSLFRDEKVAVEFAIQCKAKRRCPILFVVRDVKNIIAAYREKLFVYQEMDNYILENLDKVELKKKLIKLSLPFQRSAKRYTLSSKLNVFRLLDQKNYLCSISNISFSGFAATTVGKFDFDLKEQMRAKIPLMDFNIFHKKYGDFLPLTCQVRRLSIMGDEIGFSWEHMTPSKTEVLFHILNNLDQQERANSSKEKILQHLPFL